MAEASEINLGNPINTIPIIISRTLSKNQTLSIRQMGRTNSQFTIKTHSMKKSKQKKTQNDLLKQNLLKIRLNRRKSKLEQITQNNVKLFQRIQSQKSVYALKNLNRSFDHSQHSNHQSIEKKQIQTESTYQKSQRNLRCSSASHLRIRINGNQKLKIVPRQTKQINLQDLHQFKQPFQGVLKQNKGLENILLNRLTVTESSKELQDCQQKSRVSKYSVNQKQNPNKQWKGQVSSAQLSKMIFRKMI